MNKVAELIGIGGKTPKTSPAPVVATEEEKKKAKSARSALLSTEGGITGAELQPGQVANNDRMFGN